MSRWPASLAAYRLATGLAEPLAPALLRARARRGKEDLARLGERLGRSERARPPGPLAWLHGASLGEALSLLPLAEALLAARPALTVLLTSGTRTAAELLARRLPARAIHQYSPLDAPGATAGFVDHWRPDVGVFVESELWPNLLLAARRRGVRMALLSAKLSDRSLRNWSRFGGAARALLGGFELVLAQDEPAAARLAGLGVVTAGVADLKFGADPLPVDAAVLAGLRRDIGARPVLVAASTHPGEDALVLARFAALPAADAPLLALIPRHPERGPAIAGLAAALGLTVSLQSRGEPIGAAQVRVADALGELGLWYRLAALAVVGGSLVDGVGGHNPLEPARLGCPLISGPHVANWRGAYGELVAADACALVAAPALEAWLAEALVGSARLTAMAGRAQALVAARDRQARAVAGRLLALLP